MDQEVPRTISPSTWGFALSFKTSHLGTHFLRYDTLVLILVRAWFPVLVFRFAAAVLVGELHIVVSWLAGSVLRSHDKVGNPHLLLVLIKLKDIISNCRVIFQNLWGQQRQPIECLTEESTYFVGMYFIKYLYHRDETNIETVHLYHFGCLPMPMPI